MIIIMEMTNNDDLQVAASTSNDAIFHQSNLVFYTSFQIVNCGVVFNIMLYSDAYKLRFLRYIWLLNFI